jgi:uncharacterized phage protein (TIGR02218 family)
MASHVAGRALALVFILKITRTDGEVLALTEHSSALVVDGVTYEPGLTVGSISSSSGTNVDNTDITLTASDAVTNAELMEGRWDGASFLLQQVNWKSLADGTIAFKAGKLGNVTPKLGQFVFEMRDHRQALQSDTTAVMQATCRYRLGDSKCTKDLAAFTHAGTVTDVTSRQVFADSGLAQAADYFGEGEVVWLTGLNTGLRCKVKTHATGGVLTLTFPLVRDIEVGDTFTAIAGCRKRLPEDCRDKFDNVINFGGEYHKPTMDELSTT